MTTFGISTTVFGPSRPGAREFDQLAAHGFGVVELAAGPGRAEVKPGAPAARLRAEAAAAGIEMAGVSVALADALPALEGATELGCGLVVVRSGPCAAHGPRAGQPAPDPAALRRAIEPLAERAAALGLALAIAFPAETAAADAAAWIESFEGPPIGACLDTGHAHLRDGVPDAIETLAGCILTVHVHDNHGREDSHRPPFSGSIDWPGTLMELEKAGYAGRAILELAPDPDAATAVARAVGARTRLQAILDDLAQPMVFPE